MAVDAGFKKLTSPTYYDSMYFVSTSFASQLKIRVFRVVVKPVIGMSET